MIISEKQIMQLIMILKDSVNMNISGIFSYSHAQRLDLINNILNQQSEELKEIHYE